MRMDFERKLPIPAETKQMYPVSPEMEKTLQSQIDRTRAILAGESDKLLLLIGPCSADREDSVLDYLSRLRPVADRVADKLLIVPRLYTTKPRTTGEGYKGMVHQPDPAARPDLFHGIIAARQLHMHAVRETGFCCADEMLYPENYKYFDDLLGYLVVGARSVEDQQHRLTASAADCPVGMKNPTGGDLAGMLNGVLAAQHPHDFIYRGWAGRSHGNPYAHAILRGYTDRDGTLRGNYGPGTLLALAERYASMSLLHPAAIVDCSHANSGKNPDEQPKVLARVMESRRDPVIRRLVKGFMVESYLEDGCQPAGGSVYGKSITDPCLGWEKTERLIYDLAEML